MAKETRKTLDDSQTQTNTFVGTAPGVIQAEELLKNRLALVLGDAGPGVSDLQFGIVSAATTTEMDVTVFVTRPISAGILLATVVLVAFLSLRGPGKQRPTGP